MRFDCDQFVNECLDAGHALSPAEAVRELLERAVRAPTSLQDAFGPTTGADGGILHHSAEMTIQYLVFPPAQRTGIHEHLLWAVIGPRSGYEDNDRYRVDEDGQLKQITSIRADTGHALVLEADAMYEAAAPVNTWSAALHVYGGALFDQPAREWVGMPPTAQPIDMATNFTHYLDALTAADLLS